jgi:hypothetical protein
MDVIIYQAGIPIDEFIPRLLVSLDAPLDKFKVIHAKTIITLNLENINKYLRGG